MKKVVFHKLKIRSVFFLLVALLASGVAAQTPAKYYVSWDSDNTGDGLTWQVPASPNTADTDGDGVLDIYDLDNDNDGILDIDELYCDNPSLPIATTTGTGKYKTQLGFFDFTGAEWNAIGDTVTRTATYNGVTYTAEVIYIDIYNKVIPSGNDTTDLRNLPDNPAVPKFEGWDMNTWDVTNQPQMIKNYYNVNGTNFKEAIYYNKNVVGAKPLHGEASFKIDVKAHVEGQPDNPVPFQLVVFDAEGSGMEALNNWTGQVKYTDLQGRGFQSLEKTGTANYNDVVTVTHHTFTRTAKKVELSSDNRILYYNHTANLPGLPSNVNGLFETIDYTSSNHSVRVDVKARSGCQAFGFAVRTLCDTDSDGIPNFLDLDSDGDGCYDAIEGDEKVTAAHLNANGSINIAAYGGVNADGVPNLVNSGGAADTGGDVGQGVGYSVNPLVNACTDTDGDGVYDMYDIDKDNDGILDMDELYCDNPDLPVIATAGKGQYKTQLGFFDFTGAQWTAIGDKVTRTATYNGVTYTADVTYTYVQNYNRPSAANIELTSGSPNPRISVFEGKDINTWETGPGQMIYKYYNVTNKHEVIWVKKNDLVGEARFKVDVRAEKNGVSVPFQLVVFDAEATSLTLDNNWPDHIRFIDYGIGFQSLEKTGTGNYNDTVTISHNGFYRELQKIELSADNRVLSYNYTDNNNHGTMTGNPSNVNGLFQTIDYSLSRHTVDVIVRSNGTAQAFGFAVRTLCDADSDGTPNFLDLDSDGDGCYDAIEGDENVNASHLNADGSINIAAYGGVNADGVPNLVNPGGAADVGGDVGQGIGYSQFNNINVCADTDGDGVPDTDDIDKDNDGILDMDELYCDNPDLPSETTTGSGTFKTQLGFFDFTGAEWNAIGDKVTRTATYNGVTYTADVTYTYVQNYNRPSAVNIELTSGTPNPTKVSKFEGKDINTWAGGPEQMIYKNYNVTNKHEVIWVKGSGTLIGEARFKVEVRAEKGTVPVPFQLVVFDAEATSLTLDNNWPEQIRFMDHGYGFQSLEKTGTGNYNDVVTISHNGFYRALQKIELSADNRTLSYNYTDNNNAGVMTGNPSNVNGLFETIDYTLSKHTVDVVVKTNGGAQAFGFAVRTLCDIDADGIPNFLDLDSDGDGCFDAMEGEDYVAEEQLNADGSINIATTGGVDADGVPNLVNPGGAGDVDEAQGQGVGTSQNSAIDLCNNFWVGGTTGFVNAWDSVTNWSQGIVPYPLHDVEFANNQPGSDGKVALADLHVPVGNPKTIGRLINSTNKATIVPATASLTINEQVSGSETLDKAHKLMVKAEAGQANGTLIVTKGCTQPPIFGTVQFYAKGIKGSEETWTDNIVGSPTEGQSFTTSYQWQYFGVPVKSIVANPTFLGASLRMYDEAYNGDNTKFYQKWHWLNSSSVLEAFKGYSITQEEATTYTIAGELNFCDKTVTMTRQAPIVTGATGYVQNTRYGLGQNLFGNSYTAAIDISKLVLPDDIVEKTIYLYNTGRFHDWASTGTLTTGTSPQLSAGNWFAIPQESAKAVWNNEIPSMQGFMLKFTDTALASGPGTPITINIPYAAAGEPKVIPNTKPQLAPGQHGQRASRAIEQEQSSPLSYLRINLESASTRDALWLISREGTTDHFDDGWDGRKHFGTPTAFIFTENKDGLMQVNADKTIDGSMISFYANADTEYELTLIKSNLEQYTNLHLHDLVTETSLALDADTTYYRFTATNEGNVEKRFVILNNHKLKLKNDGSINPLNAYLKHDNLLIVNNLSDNEGQITLYSITGNNVFSQHIPIGITEIPLNLPKGIYLVNLRAESNHETVKIAVR